MYTTSQKTGLRNLVITEFNLNQFTKFFTITGINRIKFVREIIQKFSLHFKSIAAITDLILENNFRNLRQMHSIYDKISSYSSFKQMEILLLDLEVFIVTGFMLRVCPLYLAQMLGDIVWTWQVCRLHPLPTPFISTPSTLSLPFPFPNYTARNLEILPDLS